MTGRKTDASLISAIYTRRCHRFTSDPEHSRGEILIQSCKKRPCYTRKCELRATMARQIGCNLSEAEMAETVKVVNAGGTGYSGGCVSKERLLSKLAARIFPAQNDTGLSLHLPPQFRFARAEGRAKRFAALQAAWNNPYYQALDAPPPHAQTEDRLATSDAPIPAVAALVTGRFYAAPRFNPSTRQPLPEEELRRRATFDAVLGQPLVKGILEGSYMYPQRNPRPQTSRTPRSARTSRSVPATVNFLARNVQMLQMSSPRPKPLPPAPSSPCFPRVVCTCNSAAG